MASSREQLVYLITKKTSMDEAQAISYVSNITKDIDNTMIEQFIKGMVRALGDEPASQIDGAGLNVIINGVMSSEKIKTIQDVQKEKEQVKEQKIKSDEQIRETFDKAKDISNKNKDAKTPEEVAKETLNDIAGLADILPEDWKKDNLRRLSETTDFLMAKFGLDKKIAKSAASTIETYYKYKEAAKEIDQKCSPEEAEKKKDAVLVELELDQLGDKAKKNNEVVSIVKKATSKSRKKLDQLAASQETNQATQIHLAILKIELARLDEEIKGFKEALEKDPNNDTIREMYESTKMRRYEKNCAFEKMQRESALDKVSDKGKENWVYLNEKKKFMKSSYGRRIDIDKEAQSVTTKIQQKRDMLKGETNPQKRAKLVLEIMELSDKLEYFRMQSKFEAVHGEMFDIRLNSRSKDICFKSHITEEKVQFQNSQYAYLRDNLGKNIVKHREKMQREGISQEEKMLIMNDMYNLETSSLRMDLKALGATEEEIHIDLQNNGIQLLSSSETYEVEKYRIERDSTCDEKKRARLLRDLERRKECLDDFSQAMDALNQMQDDSGNKKYSSKELNEFVKLFAATRANNHFQNEISDKKIGIRFLMDIANHKDGGSVPKELKDDFFDYFKQNNKEDCLRTLVNASSLMINKALYEKNEEYEKQMDYECEKEKDDFHQELTRITNYIREPLIGVQLVMLRSAMQGREEFKPLEDENKSDRTPEEK